MNFDFPFLFAVFTMEWKHANSSAPSCVLIPPVLDQKVGVVSVESGHITLA